MQEIRFPNESLEVIGGQEDQVEIVLAESSMAYLEDDEAIEEDAIYYEVHWNQRIVSEDGAVEAPISAGDQLGYALVSWGDPSENYLDLVAEDLKVPLIAGETVEEASFLERFGNK